MEYMAGISEPQVTCFEQKDVSAVPKSWFVMDQTDPLFEQPDGMDLLQMSNLRFREACQVSPTGSISIE